jgi:hypothetical protein
MSKSQYQVMKEIKNGRKATIVRALGVGNPWSKVLNDHSFIQCSWGRGASKIQALKPLVADCKLNIILIHETMCSGEKAMDYFRHWL